MDTKLNILIAGGGTGGHVFPAIAIANALKQLNPACNILFIGARGRMEMEKVPRAGYPIKGLWISGFQRGSIRNNLLVPLKVVVSYFSALKIIKSFGAHVAVGVGGYASGPALKAAADLKIPVILLEQNSYPGVTNRWLARYARTICVAYDHMDRWFDRNKIVKTGNPVRQDLLSVGEKCQEALNYFNLREDLPRILVIGGSQGSLAINRAIAENIDFFVEQQLQLIWQTGPHYVNEAQQLISQKIEPAYQTNIRIMEFIHRMDLAYAVADLVVSRAGAIAIAELCVTARPAILIPLPSAADDHQTKNARALADENAAILLPQSEAREKLTQIIRDLMENPRKREELSSNIARFASPDASEKIAKLIIETANEKART